MSYWTLRRRAKAPVAHNIQRIYQELDAEDTLDGEVRSDLNIATRLSGTISTEGTALQNLHYTFGLESDILNEAAPPGQTSARDDDDDGDGIDVDDDDDGIDVDDDDDGIDDVDDDDPDHHERFDLFEARNDLPLPESDTESDCESDSSEMAG